MATVFIQTTAGAAHDHAVRMGRTPAAGMEAIVCYTGTPVVDVVDIQALTAETAGAECYRIDESVIPQTDISAVSTLLEPELPASLDNIHITALGYLLTNGVLWGYVPYRSDKGGLVKDSTFSWVMHLICTSTDSPTLAVTYSGFDLRSLSVKLHDRVYQSLYEELRTAFYGTLCEIVAAPIHENGDCDCIEIPLNESQIINSERVIVAKPILE